MGESTANRGLKFEKQIERRCEKLQNDNLALIHKVPTDWKVLRKYNPAKHKTEIFSGFPISTSKFVDFVGVFNKKAIAIEAKETKNKTSFPFSNIKDEQIEFLKQWVELGGKGYYIIRFETNKKVFFLEADVMHDCIDNIGRKSAPYNWFLENKNVIELNYNEIDFEKYIN